MASTGVGPIETAAFRRGTVHGKPLTAVEREKMMKPYLPSEPVPEASRKSRSNNAAYKRQQAKSRRDSYVGHALHVFTYAIVSFIFSVFIRFRSAWRLVNSKLVSLLKYHHRTPELIQRDVRRLERLPDHLSVILDFHESDEEQGNAGLEGLVNDVCEIAAWTACTGIPYLSVYERTGKLKNYIQQTHASISQTLEAYYGAHRKPALSVRAPHQPSYSPPITPSYLSSDKPSDLKNERQHLTVLLLSAEDGRDTMVDLSKTLATMAQNGSVRPEQIDVGLIDAEISEAVSSEPDLLILFSPTVVLKGYPPWQLRLTEIFHVPDNKDVNYQVFLRGLYNYAKVEMRWGR